MYHLFSQSLLKCKIQVTGTYNIRTDVKEVPKDTLRTLKIFVIIHSLNVFHQPKFKTKIKTRHFVHRISPLPRIKE